MPKENDSQSSVTQSNIMALDGATQARVDTPRPDRVPDFAADDVQVPEVENAVIEKGRVLLLEDETDLREAIRAFLAESGYTVVAVQNGSDGIREVLVSDFSMILCDLRMPKVSGEVFYRAVERIRPHLCGKFVFISGYGGDTEANSFIESVGGFLLRKPFELKELLDWVAVTEGSGGHVSAPGESKKPVAPPARPAARVAEGQLTRPASAAVPIVPTGVPVVPLPGGIPQTRPANETQSRPEFASGAFALAAFAVLLILGVSLWNRYGDAEAAIAAATTERSVREADWTEISPALEKALALRAKTGSAQIQLASISADQAKPRWTSVLRCIAPAADTGIENLQVRGTGGMMDSGACELSVSGVAIGPEPRKIADRYRQAVEENLKKTANGRPVTTRLDQLKDEPRTATELERASFVVVASIGSVNSIKEGL